MKKRIIVAICGASGSIYGIRLLKALLENPLNIYLVISASGYRVMEHETGYNDGCNLASFTNFLKKQEIVFHKDAELNIYEQDDFFTPPASGSFIHHGMVIAPCSMSTLGTIASGISDNLIQRAADVCLKEKRPLILLTRETPLSLIHIKNMYRAAESGAVIMPPCPGFYSKPANLEDLIDSVIARVLDHLNIKQTLFQEWGTKDFV